MNKKKIFFLLTVLAALFFLSGCRLPMDAEGKVIQITGDTNFSYMMTKEGIFSALFVYPLANFINLLTPYSGVALAIVIVTVTINAIVLLFTWKSNVSSQKMQMLQPEIARIQKKYEGRDDAQSRMKMSQEINQIYASNGVNMVGSLLTSFVQFPILIAVYHAVQRAESVVNGSFLGMQMETSPLIGLQQGKLIYGIAFALMLITQILSLKAPMWLQEKRAKAEAAKHFRRYTKPANPTGNMMYFMLIFISILLISWPSAMTVYYTISSCVMIGKTFLIDHFVHKELDK